MIDLYMNRSVWLQGLKTSDLDYPNFEKMTAREPTACDDPRVSGFPCFSQHKESRQRGNQHGAWTYCLKCGLRLSYISKKGMHGDSRAMGPDPAVIRFAMNELEATMTATQINSDVVNGKIMEVKGKMLQAGIKTPLALNMTYAEYLKRIAKHGRADGYQETNPITQTGLTVTTPMEVSPTLPVNTEAMPKVNVKKPQRSVSPIRKDGAMTKKKEPAMASSAASSEQKDGSYVLIHSDSEETDKKKEDEEK